MNSQPLCNRKRRFIRAFASQPDAIQAAIQAGYSPRLAEKRASQLLQDPAIRGRLEKSLGNDNGNKHLTRKAVLQGLLREAGDHTGNSSPANRLKAWELICKLMGFFNDPTESSLPTVVYDIRINGQKTENTSARPQDGHP